MGRRKATGGGSGRVNPLVIVAAVLMLAAAWWVLRPAGGGQPEETRVAAATSGAAAPMAPVSSRQGQTRAAASVPAAGDLPPIPLNYPAARPLDMVVAAYEFAARRPDVLAHVPCFCGCEHSGHASNVDCFVASRDAAGRVTWDAHGIG